MGVELKVKILVYKKENKNSDKLYKPKCQDKQVEIKPHILNRLKIKR